MASTASIIFGKKNPLFSYNKAILAFLFLLFSTIFCPKSTLAQQEPTTPPIAPPIAYNISLIGDSARFRLIIDFDKPTDHKLYLLNSPNRLLIDLPPTYFAFDKNYKPFGTDIVEKIEYGELENEGRIVVYLNESIKIASVFTKAIKNLQTNEKNHHRIIIDAIANKNKTEILHINSQVGQSNKYTKYTIVIDPGHGGIDSGASRPQENITEKFITLQFSKLLKEKLDKHKNFNIILTHAEDIYMSLEQRREIVRSHSADLFLSIHADAAPQSHVRGATFYTLSEKGSDELSRALADSHNRADSIAALQLSNLQVPISDVLIDLARRETEVFSLQFAQLAIANFKNEIRLINNPRRDANFAVLRNPYTPSILLELGYLSNNEDTKLMQDPKWQIKVAELLEKSIVAFARLNE